jgi:hypothetical protein
MAVAAIFCVGWAQAQVARISGARNKVGCFMFVSSAGAVQLIVLLRFLTLELEVQIFIKGKVLERNWLAWGYHGKVFEIKE